MRFDMFYNKIFTFSMNVVPSLDLICLKFENFLNINLKTKYSSCVSHEFFIQECIHFFKWLHTLSLKYLIEAGKQCFFIIWWVQLILTRWNPHLIRKVFLKTFSLAISICINSWGQPSVKIIFTCDKIYDGNNVGVTIEIIHKKPKLFHLVKRPWNRFNKIGQSWHDSQLTKAWGRSPGLGETFQTRTMFVERSINSCLGRTRTSNSKLVL